MTVSRAATMNAPAISRESEDVAVLNILRRHSAGILVALLLAATLVLPRWWVIASDPAEGVRVPLSPYGAGAIGYDETLYTSSVRQAYDGQIPVSDPYLETHADSTPQRSAAPHELIGVFGRVTGNTFSALAIATTIAAVCALLALYVMLYRITGSRLAAVALIPLILMAIHVLNQAEGILPLRHKDVAEPLFRVDPLREFHAWTRFPSPILLLAPFFVGVIAFPRAAETGNRRWLVLATLTLSAMIYTYSYYWTAFGLALLLWLGVIILRRERTEAMRVAGMGVAAILIALPEVIILITAARELPVDARDRVGLLPLGIDTSMAMTVLQRLVIGIPFIVALWLRRRSADLFYIALFVSPLMLVSVTGLVPQTWHYHTQIWGVFAIPAVVAGGAALFARDEFTRVARPAGVALVAVAAVAFAYVVVLQVRAVVQTDDAYAVSSDEDAAFAWMRANLESEDTVVSPSITTNLYLASLSPTAQYLSEGGFSVATDAELTDRILRAQAAFGLSETQAFGRLNVHGEDGGFPVHDATGTPAALEQGLEQYLAFYTFSFEITDQDAFRDRVDSWRPTYRALLAGEGVLAAHPADYLYCGHRERALTDTSVVTGTYVRLAYQSGDVKVYEVADPLSSNTSEFEGCG